LLKKSVAGLVPQPILTARKRGFNVPLPSWLTGPLKPLVLDVLSPRRIRETGLFDERRIGALITDHLHKRADYSRQIWGLLILMLWREECFDPGNTTLHGNAIMH
jgi:asparagine synthase (glutamine-hydrolysing)